MELAVAAESPLGQYLAELDHAATNAGGSAADLLLPSRPHAAKRKQPRPQRAQPHAPRAYAAPPVTRLANWTRARVAAWCTRLERFAALQLVVPTLLPWRPTLRDEMQQTAIGFTLQSTSRPQCRCWWRLELLVHTASGSDRLPMSVLAAVVVAAAAAALSGRLDGLVQGVFLALLVVFGLEFALRALLRWYSHRASRLGHALASLTAALERLDAAFATCLTLVKRAELASRGYRLGSGLLPPVGRLEALDDAAPTPGDGQEALGAATKRRRRCVALRRRLRALNDLLQARASALRRGEDVREAPDGPEGGVGPTADVEDAALDSQAPSLLLTALEKQHARSVLLLESAVLHLLLQDLARACSAPAAPYTGHSSLFQRLETCRGVVEQLRRSLGAWTLELHAWNASGDPVARFSRVSGGPKHLQNSLHPTEYQGGDLQLKAMATSLRELRMASETLTSLVIASQHELLVPRDAHATAEALASTRAAMRAQLQQLQQLWSRYDAALSAATSQGDDVDALDAAHGPVDELQARPSTRNELLPPSPAEPHDDCTVVFTGTSTGDGDFDLQALLAPTDAGSLTPAATFIPELRDVLAHRRASALPGRTRQVSHDPPEPQRSSDGPAAVEFALPRGPARRRPRRDVSAVSTATSALGQELQALLMARASRQEDASVLESHDEQRDEQSCGQSMAKRG